MNGDTEAEVKMYFVRVVRSSNSAREVWRKMKEAFPDVEMSEIRSVCKDVAMRMAQ